MPRPQKVFLNPSLREGYPTLARFIYRPTLDEEKPRFKNPKYNLVILLYFHKHCDVFIDSSIYVTILIMTKDEHFENKTFSELGSDVL